MIAATSRSRSIQRAPARSATTRQRLTRFETDHFGNSKSFAYDSRGNVTVETLGAGLADDPANPTTGYVTRTSYNGHGSPTSLTDPDGRLQAFTYQPATNDLLTHTTGAVAGDASAGDHTTFTYLSDGSIDTITDALGNVTQHTYRVPYGHADYPGSFKRVTLTVTDPAGTAGSDPANPADTVLRRPIRSTTPERRRRDRPAHASGGATQEIVAPPLRPMTGSSPRSCPTVASARPANAIGEEAASVQWQSVADYEAGSDARAHHELE
jgi:YD repeat-containing protein